jgi:hypothetical protein
MQVGAALGEMAVPMLVAVLFTSGAYGPYSFLVIVFMVGRSVGRSVGRCRFVLLE